MAKYTNLDGTTPDTSLRDILKWQVGDRLAGRRPKPLPFTTPRRDNDGVVLASMTPSLTWIGHSTFAMRLGKKLVVTDPIVSEHVATRRRNVAPGIDIDRAPNVDVVTVSHAHYDHLDLPSLKRIGPEALYVVPKDVGEILVKAGLPRVVELGWWDTHIEGDLKITLVPAQHWSMRMPWDRNARLWGGFVYESNEGCAYHAGDTAFAADVFTAIGQRFPRIDWAMIPIGAYDPAWFMSPQHIGPEDAGRAFDILGAKRFVAMHWGTFRLTDEPMGEPPERMRAWWSAHAHDADRLWILDVGETRALSKR